LNRAHLGEAIDDLKEELERSKQQLAHFGSMASFAGKVAAVVPILGQLFRRRHHGAENGGKRKLPFLLNSFATGTSLWMLLRTFRRKT